MRWQTIEFILKGIYLGLLVFVGWAVRERSSWGSIGQVGVCTFGVLALFLGAAALRKLREGYRVRGRLPAFVLFLLLENPGLVYAGVLLGMLLGAYSLLAGYGVAEAPDRDEDIENYWLLYCLLGGAALGVLFNVLYQVKDLTVRRWLGLGLGAALIAGGIFGAQELVPDLDSREEYASLLLLGIVPFYLLTLVSVTEESEVEIMAMCAALGVSMWLVAESLLGEPSYIPLAVLVVPVAVYYYYTRRVLPELRVFKHVLRGIGYANVGQIRPALLSLGRALQLEPANQLAREQIWHVHRLMNFDKVIHEPETLALLNFNLCLERISSLLLAGKPSAQQLAEAQLLLDLIANQRPQMAPRCDYWRAVALTHAHQYDDAARALERVLVGDGAPTDNADRREVLFPAWQLAIMLHTELTRRVGAPQLAIPGRRMSAIAAVEDRLATVPDDAGAWDLKRLLYNDLTEAEYLTQVVQGKPPQLFDHAYVFQLGQALINDPAQWERGCEYLRMAAVGQPVHAPTIYVTIAQALEKAGHSAQVWQGYETMKQLVLSVGQRNLADADRQTFFAVVKALGEDAAKRGDTAAAIDNLNIFAEYERAGINTHRALADLYERNGDPWSALFATQRGLIYDSTDNDLLAKKDRYYYSVTPQELQARLDQVQKWFDAAYCKQKARWVLDHQGEDLELLDWASHLADLAQVVEPNGLAVKVLRARILRRRGEVDQAIALLEEVRGGKPEKFASGDEEDAWFFSCRLLGDLYLNTKPDQAVVCFQEFRKHAKSGADTVYKMGVAYENLGDHARARKCYQMVAAFDGHPLKPEAQGALQRLSG